MVMRRERKVSRRSLALATSASISMRTVTCRARDQRCWAAPTRGQEPAPARSQQGDCSADLRVVVRLLERLPQSLLVEVHHLAAHQNLRRC